MIQELGRIPSMREAGPITLDPDALDRFSPGTSDVTQRYIIASIATELPKETAR
jgi:hypothetical protein